RAGMRTFSRFYHSRSSLPHKSEEHPFHHTTYAIPVAFRSATASFHSLPGLTVPKSLPQVRRLLPAHRTSSPPAVRRQPHPPPLHCRCPETRRPRPPAPHRACHRGIHSERMPTSSSPVGQFADGTAMPFSTHIRSRS